jgi:hypothetical protein
MLKKNFIHMIKQPSTNFGEREKTSILAQRYVLWGRTDIGRPKPK